MSTPDTQLVQVQGFKELQAKLLQLPRELTAPVLASALFAGAQPIVKDAQARAPVLATPDARRTPGLLRRAIRAARKRNTRHTATVSIAPRKLGRAAVAAWKKKTGQGGAANPLDPFYWKFLEFGTVKMAARPFLRPAFEAQKMAAVEATRRALAKRIAARARKLGLKFREG